MCKTNNITSRKEWTREAIINAIQASSLDGYCKTTAVGMTVATVARRMFGSFKLACTESGVMSWTEKSIECCSVDGCNKQSRSKGSSYCDTHYCRIRRAGTIFIDGEASWLSCFYCGEPSNGLKYCSDRCSSRSNRDYPVDRLCQVCGSSCATDNSGRDRLVCSDDCDVVRSRNQYRLRRLGSLEVYRDRERQAEYKRKARKRAVAYEDIDRGKVFESSGYICGLCGGHIDINIKWPEQGFATLDHIVPLSKGGSHTYDNLQPAHLLCNTSKGDRDKPSRTIV